MKALECRTLTASIACMTLGTMIVAWPGLYILSLVDHVIMKNVPILFLVQFHCARMLVQLVSGDQMDYIIQV